MNAEFLNSPPVITEHGVFTAGEQYSYGIGDCVPAQACNYVQDEILTKMAEAIEDNDLKKARELVKLAKALKEL